MMYQAEVRSAKALHFYEACEGIISSLFSRWLDEKEYEDIFSYQIPLNKVAQKHGVRILKMNKSPFGCNFAVDGKTFRLKISSREYSYKRIA